MNHEQEILNRLATIEQSLLRVEKRLGGEDVKDVGKEEVLNTILRQVGEIEDYPAKLLFVDEKFKEVLQSRDFWLASELKNLKAMLEKEQALNTEEQKPEKVYPKAAPEPVIQPSYSQLNKLQKEPVAQEVFVAQTDYSQKTKDESFPIALLAIAGGIILAVGLIFLVSLGITSGVITPTMRVLGGMIISLAVGAIGYHLSKTNRDGWPALVMMAASTVGLFASVISAYSLFHLIPTQSALALNTAIAGAGFILSIKSNKEIVAGFALLGGMLSPLLLNQTYDPIIFAWIILPFVALAVASGLKDWKTLSVLGHLVFFASLLGLAHKIIQKGDVVGSSIDLTLVCGFALISFLAMSSSVFVKPDKNWSRLVFMAFSGLLVVGTYLVFRKSAVQVDASAFLQSTLPKTDYTKSFLFLLSSGVVYALVGLVSKIQKRDSLFNYAAQAATFLLSISIALLLNIPEVVVAFAATSLVALWLARVQEEITEGLFLLAFAGLYFICVDAQPKGLLYGNNHLAEALFSGACVLAVFVVLSIKTRVNKPDYAQKFALASIFVFAYLVSLSIVTILTPQADSVSSSAQTVFSIWVAVCGLGVVTLGLRERISLFRSTGLSLLALAVAKLVLYDLANVSQTGRIFSFILVGLLILAAAYVYQKLLSKYRIEEKNSD